MYGVEHEYVFLRPNEVVPFDTTSFSKYVNSCFKKYLHMNLNAQQMRRIFATGVPASVFMFFMSPIFGRLHNGQPWSGITWVACNFNAYQREHAWSNLCKGCQKEARNGWGASCNWDVRFVLLLISHVQVQRYIQTVSKEWPYEYSWSRDCTLKLVVSEDCPCTYIFQDFRSKTLYHLRTKKRNFRAGKSTKESFVMSAIMQRKKKK